ncbi:MAG: hypothetical protein CMH30_00860 [Micavibrio sp.]|nr:hypothetical protein [Micavibrio sp.]
MSYYSKLNMDGVSKSEGSFVRDLEGKTGVGFQDGMHVHKDWYAKTIAFEDALDMAEDAYNAREDILAPVKQIQGSVNSDNEFVFMVGDREFKPTDHSLQQFSIRSKVPSSSVLRELRKQEDYDSQDADVMSYLANNALRRLDQDKVFRLRTYKDGTCRAFVTDKYAPVDNRWYLEVLQTIIPDGRLSHWKGDEDTIYGNILIPDSIMDYGQDDDSDYGGMVSIGNCEIGKRRITQSPSLFRSICLNGCIWGQVKGKEIRKRHIGDINLEHLEAEIHANVTEQLSLIPQGLDLFLSTKQMENGDVSMTNIIAAICSQEKIGKRESREVINQYAEYENHERNLFGVVNAITRAGQEFDNETWYKLDNVGGSLINMGEDRWSAVKKRADTFQDADLEKIFAPAK